MVRVFIPSPGSPVGEPSLSAFGGFAHKGRGAKKRAKIPLATLWVRGIWGVKQIPKSLSLMIGTIGY